MSVRSDRGSSHGKYCTLDRQVEAPQILHPPEKSLSEGSVGWRKNPLVDGYRLPLRMTTKMKGLFKGFHYISHIFGHDLDDRRPVLMEDSLADVMEADRKCFRLSPNSKEREMQIGYPTDVKHVAHIGWDGPSMSTPSWMKEFRSGPEYSSAPLNNTGEGKDLPSPNRRPSRGQYSGSPVRDLPELPRPSRRHQMAASGDSPSAEGSGQSSRRNKSKGDSGDVPSRQRRHQTSRLSNNGSDSPANDSGGSGKSSRRRKSKGSSGGGSSGSSRRRSKALAANYSDPDMKKDSEPYLPALKPTMEEE